MGNSPFDGARAGELPVRALRFALNGVGQVMISGDTLLAGVSFRETGNNATTSVTVFDGADNTGIVVWEASFNANQSRFDALPTPGVYCQQGIFVVTPGAGNVIVYVRDIP